MIQNKISDGELLALYHQGLTNREIAEKLRVTQAAVHYRLVKLGLLNNCHEDNFVTSEQVEILHGMGLTSVGIAFLLKTNVQSVSQRLKVLGLTDNCYQLEEIVNCMPGDEIGDSVQGGKK